MSQLGWSWLALLPHGQCYAWLEGLIALHAISDGLIALAYFSIPFALIRFIRLRPDIPYSFLFWLFGSFIVACGVTHLLEVASIWHPYYWATGWAKAGTALISVATACACFLTLPRALMLRSAKVLDEENLRLEEHVQARTAELASANQRLQAEVAQREKAEAEVKRLNASLLQRLDEFQTLFDLLPVGVGIATKQDCSDIRINRAFADMLNISKDANASLTAPEAEKPTTFRVRIEGREVAPSDLPMQRCARDNVAYHNIEESIERSDGVQITVLSSVVPLRDDQGNARGCVGVFYDITAQKSFEDEIRLTLEAAPQAMIRADEAGRIDLVNTAAETLFGYGRDELLGLSVEALMPLPFRAGHTHMRQQFASAPAARKMGAGRPLRARRRDGSDFPVEIALNPLRTRQGSFRVLAAIHDISERLAHEERQRELDRKLQETQKLESLGILAGGIAHDFNNLLTGILGNAGLLKEMHPDDAVAGPLLHDIETAAERAADLCRQMLAYAGKGRFVVRRIDVNALIKETLPLLGAALRRTEEVFLQLAPELPLVRGDATQLRQILMNLILNATEAMMSHPGRLTLRSQALPMNTGDLRELRHSEEASPGLFVLLEVIDDGCGMDDATLQRIFDPFFTTKFTGRGLGLAAVLGIIRGHRGALHVRSQPGRGTHFQIFLPSVAATPEEADLLPPPSGPVGSGHGHVLVIDDEEAVRHVTERVLVRYGYVCTVAAGGEAGLRELDRLGARINLVLLDLTMPGMSGAETYLALRAAHPQLPVVLMSGYNEQEVAAQFPSATPLPFLPKPIQVASLLRVLGETLRPS